ncbi:MAG: ABC transporter substrate-binding protein [Acidovorax sp.]|uniref:ABC transporter substrate-binding protein n=1 Tax=Acidovorax sp. TaxID=1872122 RepID=UPI0039E60A57
MTRHLRTPLKDLALSCAILMAAAPGKAAPQDELQLADARHKTIVLARPATRIVSLQPSFTEAICALGGCDVLVGVDRFSVWPRQVGALPTVGSLREPDIERIVALRPDVVLARPGHRMDARLEALGVKVLALNTQTYEDMAQDLETLAVLLGKPGAGTRLWQRTQQRLAELRGQVPAQWRGKKVYFELHGAKSATAAGEASFIGQTLHGLGLVNIAGRNLPMYPQLSPEYVVRADPDLIITMADLPTPLADRPGWGRIAALRNGDGHCRIPNGDYEMLVRPGPRIDEAAQLIVQCLQQLALLSK